MITLKKIDEDNYRKVLAIKMNEEQDKFVAPNVVSLAQAYVFYHIAKPFAIYNGDEVIGFMMLDWDEEEREAGIWRFMIAEEHQNKGYGRKAMECAINIIKEANKFDYIYLSYVPGNDSGEHLYESIGFKKTGEIEDGEIIMKLDLC